MQHIRLYGYLHGPKAVKDVETGEPAGGVMQRIEIVMESNQPTRAILTDIKGEVIEVVVAEIELK